MTSEPKRADPGSNDGLEHPRVAVCIPTYRRTSSLERLLSRLLESSFAEMEVQIIVVDNDSEESARDVVRMLGTPIVRYAVEPTPGIVAARNRLVDEAASWGADFVAFIDDDEYPDSRWLELMLATASAYRADLVGGPVIPEYGPTTPAWIRASGFFCRPRWRTGTEIPTWGTCNLLVRCDTIREVRARFSDRFATSGGSDTHFVGQLLRAGKLLVWCDEAVVVEEVPPARASAGWMLRRAFRAAGSYSVSEVDLGATRLWRVRRLARMTAKFFFGVALLVPGIVRGRAGVVDALGRCAGALGGAAGLVGVTYHEYRR